MSQRTMCEKYGNCARQEAGISISIFHFHFHFCTGNASTFHQVKNLNFSLSIYSGKVKMFSMWSRPTNVHWHKKTKPTKIAICLFKFQIFFYPNCYFNEFIFSCLVLSVLITTEQYLCWQLTASHKQAAPMEGDNHNRPRHLC